MGRKISSITYTISADENCGGTSYGSECIVDGERENFGDTDGDDRDPAAFGSSPDAWLAAAKDMIKLPKDITNLGLGWDDAEIKPLGWSQGAGHAPNGITISWDLDAARVES